MNKDRIMKYTKPGLFVAIAVVIALLAVMFPVHIELVPAPGSTMGLHQGNFRITIGNKVNAQAANYTCDGINDDVEFQQALDALPDIGGQLLVLAGVYNFTPATTVTRAIPNVTILGIGASVIFNGDGSTPIFTAGDDNWLFSNFQTDAGGLEMGATNNWLWINVIIAGTLYPLEPTLTDINDLIDLVEADVAAVEGSLGQLNATVVQYGINISALEGDMVVIQGDLADVQSDLTGINTTVNYHSGNISALLSDVSDLEGDVSDLQGDVADFQSDLTAINTTVNYHSGNISALQSDVSDLEGDVAGFQSDLTSINATVNYHSGNISTLQSDMASLNNTITWHTGNSTGVHGVTGSVVGTTDSQVLTNKSLGGNLDFAGFLAVAMRCDQGATFPISPATGQWFLHTPTGRTILYLYVGSTWMGMLSLGTMTVYVDKTDGTDSPTKGTGLDSNAFQTIQYAVNSIPGTVGGNVIINVNAESYTETVTITGKTFTGNYGITLVGSLTVNANIVMDGTGQAGATTTQAAVYENGMTTNQYANMLLKFTSGSNNGLYRIIDSNSNDAGTRLISLCGLTLAAIPVVSDTATIYTWGTTIQKIIVNNGQKGITLSQLAMSNSAGDALAVSTGAAVSLSECSLTVTTLSDTGCINISNAFASTTNCYLYDSYNGASATYAVLTGSQASVVMVGTKVRGVDASSSYGVVAQRESFIELGCGNVFVDWAYGALVNKAGSCSLQAVVLNIYNRFTSNAYGVGAIQHGLAIGSSGACYFASNSVADTTADAATYSVIVA